MPSEEIWLAAVAPALAVIQVGADNDYGHPHAEVLEKLAGARILRSDRHGRVHLWSDGKRVWMEAELGEVEPWGER